MIFYVSIEIISQTPASVEQLLQNSQGVSPVLRAYLPIAISRAFLLH